MSDTISIPGFYGEIPDDPRVKEAVDKLQGKNLEAAATDAVLNIGPLGLEKYGLKMRPQNLMQMTLLSKIMRIGEFDTEYQAWIWIWSLCAPLIEIYSVVEKAKNEGIPYLMSQVHEWSYKSGLPNQVSQEVIDAVGHTFALASQLAPKVETDDSQSLKKNPTPGG